MKLKKAFNVGQSRKTVPKIAQSYFYSFNVKKAKTLKTYLISIGPVRTIVKCVWNSVAIFVIVGVAHVAEGVLIIISLYDVDVEKKLKYESLTLPTYKKTMVVSDFLSICCSLQI